MGWDVTTDTCDQSKCGLRGSHVQTGKYLPGD